MPSCEQSFELTRMDSAGALPWAGHTEPPSLLGGSAMASGRSIDHCVADQAWTRHLIRSRWPQVLRRRGHPLRSREPEAVDDGPAVGGRDDPMHAHVSLRTDRDFGHVGQDFTRGRIRSGRFFPTRLRPTCRQSASSGAH